MYFCDSDLRDTELTEWWHGARYGLGLSKSLKNYLQPGPSKNLISLVMLTVQSRQKTVPFKQQHDTKGAQKDKAI